MAKTKIAKKAAAFIYYGEGLCFLQDKASGALSLPMVDKDGTARGSVAKLLRKRMCVPCGFVRRVPKIVVNGPAPAYVDAFVVEADFSAFESETVQVVFIEERAETLRRLDPISRAAAKRAFTYGPFYRQKIRTVPLLPEDQEKAYWQIACIKYFSGTLIPYAEAREFEGLVHSASSLTRINEAFASLCNHYQADPKRYIRHLNYRRNRRESLK